MQKKFDKLHKFWLNSERNDSEISIHVSFTSATLLLSPGYFYSYFPVL